MSLLNDSVLSRRIRSNSQQGQLPIFLEHDLDETIALPKPRLAGAGYTRRRLRAHAIRQTQGRFTKELGVLSTRSFEIDER